LLIYAVGTSHMLRFEWTNRGPWFPTPWSHILYPYYTVETIEAVRVFLFFMIMTSAGIFMTVWNRRCKESRADRHMRGSVEDGEQCLFCLSTADGQDQNMELSSSESVDGSEDDAMTSDDVDDHDDEQAPAFS
jgi:hypothetical protein